MLNDVPQPLPPPVCLAAIVVFVFCGRPVLTLIATFTVIMTNLSVMGLMYVWGWHLGAIEGMSITSLVGLSLACAPFLGAGGALGTVLVSRCLQGVASSFIASSEDLSHIPQDKVESYRWRIQFRKGVHVPSGNGVTTLVDVSFQPEDIGV